MKSFLLFVLSLFGLACTSMRAAAEVNFCLMTSQAALRSCRVKARSDLWLAFGKCDNVAAAAKRRNCKEHASANLKDALSECEDQHAVRQTACQRLGPAPYDPVIDLANFVDRIDNPYFPLTPGTVYIYEGQTKDGLERDEFFVTHKTVKILGVTTVEVHDTVTVDDELTEDTLDWFAQDKGGNVWYFGENTMELENGRPSTLAGSFKAGVNRTKPGIVMEAHRQSEIFTARSVTLAIPRASQREESVRHGCGARREIHAVFKDPGNHTSRAGPQESQVVCARNRQCSYQGSKHRGQEQADSHRIQVTNA